VTAYTSDQLRAAWESLLRERPHWPATFEEAMEHPLYMRLVRIRAFHGHVEEVMQHRDIGTEHVEAPPMAANPYSASNFSPDERRAHLRSQSFPVMKRDPIATVPQRRSIDRKSLAAGEKPEPDTQPPVL